jgi:hypothetical protein
MTFVSMETILNTTADNVWETISDFNGLTKFIPAIVKSTTDGTGVGSVRTLTLDNGALIVEKLESLDETLSRTLSYSIVDSPLPVEGYLATMQVQDCGDNRCKLVWSSRFEPKGTTKEEAKGIIEGIYSMGFDGLKKLFGG